MKPVAVIVFVSAVVTAANAVSLEVKPFKRLIPADRLRGAVFLLLSL